MKHTIKLLTLAFMLATILTLTGCPGPVNTVDVWDDGVVTTEPTCTAEGVKTYTCSNGETRTETIPALGHDFGEWTVDTPATCTTNGSKKHTCSRCELEETADIEALGHTWEDTIITPATCETAGEKTHTCSVCGDNDNGKHITIAALGHDYQGGYCEREGCTNRWQYGNHITVMIKNFGIVGFENVYFSFANDNIKMNLNDLIHLKSRFVGYKVDSVSTSEEFIVEYDNTEMSLSSGSPIYILIKPITNE